MQSSTLVYISHGSEPKLHTSACVASFLSAHMSQISTITTVAPSACVVVALLYLQLCLLSEAACLGNKETEGVCVDQFAAEAIMDVDNAM